MWPDAVVRAAVGWIVVFVAISVGDFNSASEIEESLSTLLLSSSLFPTCGAVERTPVVFITPDGVSVDDCVVFSLIEAEEISDVIV